MSSGKERCNPRRPPPSPVQYRREKSEDAVSYETMSGARRNIINHGFSERIRNAISPLV